MSESVEQARRALFEAACKKLDKEPGKRTVLGYSNPYGNEAWMVLNATLDAVVIDLSGVDEYDGWQAVDSCRAAIESTGLGITIK